MTKTIRNQVREHYGKLAKAAGQTGKKSCCSSASSCCNTSPISALYSSENLQGVPAQAVNASLGCANPQLFANLQPGETVLDLGSGGGIDVLIASKAVGNAGKVYGLDMTDEMLALAAKNKARMGAENVEFLKGYIEDIPLPEASVDVILSNCVINLSEDKPKALEEAFRVLKPGGRLAVADIVTLKPMPQAVREHAALWFGCIAGALQADEYRGLLEQAGFRDVQITPEHIYTRDIIENEFLDGSQQLPAGVSLEDVDGIFAGALIRAGK